MTRCFSLVKRMFLRQKSSKKFRSLKRGCEKTREVTDFCKYQRRVVVGLYKSPEVPRIWGVKQKTLESKSLNCELQHISAKRNVSSRKYQSQRH